MACVAMVLGTRARQGSVWYFTDVFHGMNHLVAKNSLGHVVWAGQMGKYELPMLTCMDAVRVRIFSVPASLVCDGVV